MKRPPRFGFFISFSFLLLFLFVKMFFLSREIRNTLLYVTQHGFDSFPFLIENYTRVFVLNTITFRVLRARSAVFEIWIFSQPLCAIQRCNRSRVSLSYCFKIISLQTHLWTNFAFNAAGIIKVSVARASVDRHTKSDVSDNRSQTTEKYSRITHVCRAAITICVASGNFQIAKIKCGIKSNIDNQNQCKKIYK